MKQPLDQHDIAAEREAKAIQKHRRSAPRTLRPFYGRNHHKKMSREYLQSICDAEIVWECLLRSDAKRQRSLIDARRQRRRIDATASKTTITL